MTHSVELFICMIIGLVMGHAIFNTGDYSHIKYFIANLTVTYSGHRVKASPKLKDIMNELKDLTGSAYKL